jgi:Protein of unknown function (DUF3551)
MRMTLLALVALAAGATATPAAAAPSYPWCANYSTSGGQCAFNTFEQCMEDVSGIGGSCRQNPGYQPPAAYNYAPRTRLRHNPAR